MQVEGVVAGGASQTDRVAATPPLVGEFNSAADAFEAAAVQFAGRTAYVDGSTGERWTFGDWFRRSDALAGELAMCGVGAGDVVAILLPSGFGYAVAYGAIVLTGGVATGVNARLGVREIAAILDCRRATVRSLVARGLASIRKELT